MANENEPAKLLLAYLQRADELQKHEPLVAYYCRLYAMERGLKIPQSERTKTPNSLLISLMNQLEKRPVPPSLKDKKSLNLGPDDNLHLEGFALNVFSKADKQDLAGRADLNTAKTFYAASIFFEILNQFGELQPNLEQKQKYAAWKAADIKKALKEGRKPVPGPPGGDEDLSIPSSTISGEYDFESSQSDPATRPPPCSESLLQSYNKVNHQPPENLSSASLNLLLSPPLNMPSSVSRYPTDDYLSHDIHPTSGYPKDGHPSHNIHQASPASRSENSAYSQPYHHQSSLQEPQQHLPHNYPHEMPSYSNTKFQSYPSFNESSLPAVPPHYYSYHQGSDASYSNLPGAGTTNYSSATQYNPSSRNGFVSETEPSPTQTHKYDSNYQPPADKITEAHKASRFAVGALAFDDVFVAVDYLKKSLELLTNPSAGN